MSSQKNQNEEKTIEECQNLIRNVLPPKKRYQFEAKAGEDKIKKSTVEIVAGVIRHTSSPDHCIGYVYKSSK